MTPLPSLVAQRQANLTATRLLGGRFRPRRALTLGTLVITLGCLMQPHIAASEPDAEDLTVRTMCQRGLGTSAIAYVEAQLRPARDSATASKWTMRLMECFAQVALRDATQAERLWPRCDATLEDFKQRDARSARLPWLEWQAARCDLLHAQSLLATYLAIPGNAGPRDQALELVRKILRRMESLEDDIRGRMPLAARQSVSGGEQASPQELTQLLVDSGLLRCEALLIRARLYPDGSKDRVAAATDVETQATEILKSAGQSWASRGPLEIARASALLELGQHQQGIAKLIELARTAGGTAARRATILAIEALATQGQLSRARTLLPTIEADGPSPEAALARLRLDLAELNRTTESSRQQQLNQLVDQARQIGIRFGHYWRSRADALLTGSVSSDALSGNSGATIDLMLVEVRQLIAAGDEAAAVQKLLQFRDTESAAERGDNAVQLALQASALLERAGDWLGAADAAETTAVRFASAAGAASTHRRCVLAISRALRAGPGNQQLVARYETALVNQLLNWPDDPQSAEPAAWLTRWLNGQDRGHEMTDVLQQQAIRCRDPNAARSAWNHWLATVTGLADASRREAAIDRLRSMVSADASEEQPGSAAVMLLAAEVATKWLPEQEQRTMERRWNQLQSSANSQHERRVLTIVDWLHTVRRSETQPGPRGAPNPLAQQVAGEAAPELLVGLAPALTEAIAATPLSERRRWALHYQLNEWPSVMAAPASLKSQAAVARILSWTGQLPAGLERLRTLARQHPRDGNVQLHLAACLAESGAEGRKESNQIAKRIAVHSPAGSEVSWAARWQLLRNQMAAGQTSQAQQAAELLLASQPFDMEIWKTRFERIAK